jgi:hypothetical protein
MPTAGPRSRAWSVFKHRLLGIYLVLATSPLPSSWKKSWRRERHHGNEDTGQGAGARRCGVARQPYLLLSLPCIFLLTIISSLNLLLATGRAFVAIATLRRLARSVGQRP